MREDYDIMLKSDEAAFESSDIQQVDDARGADGDARGADGDVTRNIDDSEVAEYETRKDHGNRLQNGDIEVTTDVRIVNDDGADQMSDINKEMRCDDEEEESNNVNRDDAVTTGSNVNKGSKDGDEVTDDFIRAERDIEHWEINWTMNVAQEGSILLLA